MQKGSSLIPPIESIRSQRKQFQTSDGACDVRVSGSVLLWERFVSSIAFEREKWKAAPLFQMCWLLPESDVPCVNYTSARQLLQVYMDMTIQDKQLANELQDLSLLFELDGELEEIPKAIERLTDKDSDFDNILSAFGCELLVVVPSVTSRS